MQFIKSILAGPARVDNSAASNTSVPPPAARGNDRITKALNAAVDALAESSAPTGNTDLPLGSASPPDKKQGPRQEEIEANKRRAELRAETERLKKQNQLDRENAAKQQQLAAEKARQDAIRRESSWETVFKPYRPAEPVTVTEELLRAIIHQGGMQEFIATKAAKVQSHLDDWDNAFAARGQFSRAEFKRQLHEDMEDNEATLRAGHTDLRILADAEAFDRQASLNRDICKAAQRKAAEAVNPVLLEIAEEIENTARKLSVNRATAERNEAYKLGITYSPSCVLLALVSVGYDFKQFAEYNWLCSVMTCPRATMYGILDLTKGWQ